ncbi:MAG TPA: DUF1697 domain-containing protein [Solirubrobacterales bacterium]
MDLYVAFLRGMNLGGRRIKNDELRRPFEEWGFEGVSTFRASGNVIFESDEEDEEALAARIESGLGEALGYEVPVFLRSAAEVLAIAAHEPFDLRLVSASTGKLQVSLLKEAPEASVRSRVLALSTDEDRLAVHGRELYWLPSGGISDSTLDLKAIDAALGLATMRTIGTIEQIAAKHCAG